MSSMLIQALPLEMFVMVGQTHSHALSRSFTSSASSALYSVHIIGNRKTIQNTFNTLCSQTTNSETARLMIQAMYETRVFYITTTQCTQAVNSNVYINSTRRLSNTLYAVLCRATAQAQRHMYMPPFSSLSLSSFALSVCLSV